MAEPFPGAGLFSPFRPFHLTYPHSWHQLGSLMPDCLVHQLMTLWKKHRTCTDYLKAFVIEVLILASRLLKMNIHFSIHCAILLWQLKEARSYLVEEKKSLKAQLCCGNSSSFGYRVLTLHFPNSSSLPYYSTSLSQSASSWKEFIRAA